MRRLLAVPRNFDAPPPVGAAEIFGGLFVSNVPNDGNAYPLLDTQSSTGIPLFMNPSLPLYLRWLRVEWSALDVTIPPPLSLSITTSTSGGVGLAAVRRIVLYPLEEGTPAMERRLTLTIPPFQGDPANSFNWVLVSAINTGAVAQQVGAYLWGWQVPSTMRDGDAYAA